ncbi:ImmA/IrrE family metallo-endopeptidase [Cellulomonas sp. P4]|uniref:ImmA/IrrE family metallo-endopeptidase n=1 Tax=Cellulomonas sp. P4 TaxID=3142533 RepID=UPI0031BB76B5
MEELLAKAAAQGVRVAWRDLGRRAGEYHSSGLILLNPRRSETTQRVTLAHELGHAHYGHTRVDDRREHEHQERLADRFGARLLISPMEYAAAEQLVGPHPGALARELGVTTKVIEAWRAVALLSIVPTQRTAG